jgi:triosephosphate isomerase
MKKLIVGNWKLNPILVKEALELASMIKISKKNTVVICPPSVFLGLIDFPLLGAQDCFWKNKGPFTGQVSPLTLKSLKVKYCIVGHSEKRAVGETDEQVKEKVRALLEAKIVPIVCVGFGTTVLQDDLEVVDVLKEQLSGSLGGLELKDVVVAYEPVWAISSGNPYATKKVATPEHAERIALYIKTKFKVAKVLYGGSVNGVNAKSFLEQPHLDGLLVGGASLIPEDFNKIIS